MKTKTQLWESFTGKKVLVIYSESYPKEKKLGTSIVVGCNPDIGICLQEVGKKEPWFVVHGKLSPHYHQRNNFNSSRVFIFMNEMFKQIQSGYCSTFMIEKLLESMCLSSSRHANCPYNM